MASRQLDVERVYTQCVCGRGEGGRERGRERSGERDYNLLFFCFFFLFLLQVAVHSWLILYLLQQSLSLMLYSALCHLNPGPSDLTFAMFLDFLLMNNVPPVPWNAMCPAQIICNEDLLLFAVEEIAGSSKVSTSFWSISSSFVLCTQL